MASTSLMLARNYSYKVFCSFHGPDARKTLVSHIRKQFKTNGITMFDDNQGIERSAEIPSSLIKAIRESRISIVILSEKYASSSWCLDELVEILECRKTMGQIVMTIFYGVDPSHVRKQIGKFGKAFDETCARRTEEKQKWSKALNQVGNIAGEDFSRWDNEAIMIEKIAKDVLVKLNATPSRDFDGMVGLEDHLKEIQTLLDLHNDGVKMVAIAGPAGIGKTTIARALYDLLANRFQLSCFVNNLRESSHSGFDEHGLKLSLQNQFLSNILNQSGLIISHLGAMKIYLSDRKVLIILDDVNHVRQLEALANETTWFGPGSRILVTTENKELLQQHGINNTYNVEFPTNEDALKILCKYAFRETSPCHSFRELAKSVTELCGNLPLGLRVVGSTLCGKNEVQWKHVVSRLETTVDRDIEDILRVGYESLDEKEQRLFLHIAVFFGGRYRDSLETMFAESDLNVEYGLKILEMRSLIEISVSSYIEMHKLLRKVGKNAIHKQEPWKRQILIDPHEICDVLEDAKGTRVVSGISFDISNMDHEVCINERAFKRMPNLRFLRVYKSRNDGNYRMHIPEEMEFPSRLRLLHWESYPGKSLHAFNPEYLVELCMRHSELEKLWEGTQPLRNLKEMDLEFSMNLKELPDLSNATNLESLVLNQCESLVELPSSILHLHKLETLELNGCINLQVIPADMNLASLVKVHMRGCSRLRNIPVMSTNIRDLDISQTAVEDLPPIISLCSRLESLYINSKKLKGLTHLPKSVTLLDLQDSHMEKIPDCIKNLHQLSRLDLQECRRLTSLPELPRSLKSLIASNCLSMETIFCPLNTPNAQFTFINCFKLSQQTRREMIQNSSLYRSILLPGRILPGEFEQRMKGNTLTVVLDGNRSYSGLLFCVVISPHQNFTDYFSSPKLLCRPIGQSDFHPIEILLSDYIHLPLSRLVSTKHLFIFRYRFEELYRSEVNREMMFEFSINRDFNIIECGAKILTQEEIIEGSYKSGSDSRKRRKKQRKCRKKQRKCNDECRTSKGD